MLILVLESSTTSAKAMLFCSDRGVIDIKTETYLPQFSDGITQDAQGIFKQTAELGRRVAGGADIDMIAVGSTYHSLMLCNKDMEPATRTFLWSYTGASDIAKGLREDAEYVQNFYKKTGCMVHAIYPAFKLMKLGSEGLNLKDYYVSGQGSYTFYQLTGKRLETDSMASGSGLFNLHTGKYDDDILAELGIQDSQLGEIVTYKDIQPLSKDGAKLLGLKKGIPVIPACPDGGLNQVGAGALEEGIMTFSVGTSAAIRISTKHPVLSDNASTWCYMSPTGYMSGAATSGACNCIDWIKDQMFPSNITYREIESTPVDRQNLPTFLPFLFGERCPGWYDERLSGFFDVSPAHSPYEFYNSVLEGVLYNIYQCYEELCKQNQPPKRIKLSGGILNSPLWTQMCCDIFQQEMECSNLKQTSVLGGAILALNIAGKTADIKKLLPNSDIKVKPNPQMKAIYKEKYLRYLDWYNRTMPV